eukprot:gene31215-6364_t
MPAQRVSTSRSVAGTARVNFTSMRDQSRGNAQSGSIMPTRAKPTVDVDESPVLRGGACLAFIRSRSQSRSHCGHATRYPRSNIPPRSSADAATAW